MGLNITVERTKGERRSSSNPDGSKSRECFKCGKVGHYARECRGGSDRRGGYDRYERRDRRGGDRRDYDRRDRYERRSRSRSPIAYGRSARDEEPRRRDSRSRSRSPRRSPSYRY